jgi:hypothetical protein
MNAFPIISLALAFHLAGVSAMAVAGPPECAVGESFGPVQAPVFVRNLYGQTGWYASPLISDLDGDGHREVIAAYYDVFVFSSVGTLVDRTTDQEGRVYAPHVVFDLDRDGVLEVVAGRGHEVFVWQLIQGELTIMDGWPADTTTGNNPPEIRGLAAADLDRDGTLEIIASTTQTVPTSSGGSQIFVLTTDGDPFQPAGGHSPAWPRYNSLAGAGNDADRNGPGHSGYGCYGLNVGIGDIDDDRELEILATYDNHHLQAFDHDGVALDASSYFTNRSFPWVGHRMTWGQFIRWADDGVEHDHYHLHTGTWPHPGWTEWLQWTASPPSVADLDQDGLAEVIGVPNVEMYEPYQTQAYAVMVLEGGHGDGERSARRKSGWEMLPRGDAPVAVEGWYPPGGVPAPTVVDISGDARPEIVASLNDGFVYAFNAEATRLWRTSYRHGKPIMFSSEVAAADLNRDGLPELILTTYGDPNVHDSGRLMVLSADGAVLHDLALPGAGHDGNGNGAPAAPTIGDLDGDGQLEILVQTFDHGLDVFTVPGSGTNCLPWPTARGGPLRTGQPSGLWMLDEVFADGFDKGLLSGWSMTRP